MLIGDNPENNGFRLSIEYFLENGYQKSELYGSMWGYPDVPHLHFYQAEYVLQVRKFIDAVIEYTNASEIDVIAHSFGVIYGRRALLGGWAKSYSKLSISTDTDRFYIGAPLQDRVKNFIGIAGPTWGNPQCFKPGFKSLIICNSLNGNWPGDENQEPFPINFSKFLLDMNNSTQREAQSTYSLYSLAD